MVDFGDPVGHERGYRSLAVVISADRLNRSAAGLAIVVPLTTTRRDLPSHVELEPGETGLQRTSYAKVEDLKSVSTARLTRLLGTAPPAAVHRIGRIVSMLLDLP